MIKKRELTDCHKLYELMIDPAVFPYVRQKANSYDEFLFLTKQTIEAEERGELISRTICDEWGNPIGTISLFDINKQAGFLGTWIGRPYHSKGYNQLAKEAFFNELFYEHFIETVYLKIRPENVRSKKAAEKLPYVSSANEIRKDIDNDNIYDLFLIDKDQFTLYQYRQQSQAIELKEA